MKNNKEKIRMILIMILIFIMGIGVGMTFAFMKFINMLKEYNVNIRDFL